MNNLVEWMVENEGPVVPLSSPKAKGFTTVAIGKVLNLHYTSIVHHKQSFKLLHEVDSEFRHIWAIFSEK